MYSIRFCDTQPQIDTMPVFKTIYHPLANGTGFRPLAYARCAYVADRGMLVDLQAFDRRPDDCALTPPDGSCVGAAFGFGGGVLSALANAEGDCRVYVDGVLRPELKPQTHAYAGEDETGWYWGVRFYLERAALDAVGAGKLAAGREFKADFYKFRRSGDMAHIASTCPAPADVDPVCPASALADFVITA